MLDACTHTRSLMNSSQSVKSLCSECEGERENIPFKLLPYLAKVHPLPGRLHAGGGTFMDTEYGPGEVASVLISSPVGLPSSVSLLRCVCVGVCGEGGGEGGRERKEERNVKFYLCMKVE